MTTVSPEVIGLKVLKSEINTRNVREIVFILPRKQESFICGGKIKLIRHALSAW